MKRATIIVILLMSCCVASAQLTDEHTLAYWKIDEGGGDFVEDFSPYGNHGTVENATWITDAKTGGAALEFNGTNSLVVVPDSPSLHPSTGSITIGAWIKVYSNPKGWTTGGGSIVYKGSAYQWVVNSNGALWLGIWGGRLESIGTYDFEQYLNEWHHCATTYDSITQQAQIFVDGELNIDGTIAATIDQSTNDLYMARKVDDGGWFHGIIDEVRISDIVRTQDEIQASMLGGPGNPYARNPNPPDGSIYEDTWVNLSWKPGAFAVTHDVYLGEDFDDVNDGLPETFRGNQTFAFLVVGFPGYPYPEGLVPGTTYYWRIDEVNDADPNSPWKGDVWSFTVPSKQAYNPSPSDCQKYVNPDRVILRWTAGYGAKVHYLIFSDNFDEVNDAVAGLPQTETVYDAGTLEIEKTYYWRIDEFDGMVIHKGNVWSFQTLPNIAPHPDPNLVGWWKLDEGQGNTTVDWSGHEHHGVLMNGPQWTMGYDGGCLDFDGRDDYVNFADSSDWPAGFSPRSLCGWGKTNTVVSGWQWIVSYGTAATSRAMFIGLNGQRLVGAGYADPINVEGFWQADIWHHICLTYDGTIARLYADGIEVGSEAKNWDLLLGRAHIGRQVNDAAEFWNGLIDDVRLYSRVLTQEEIQLVMRGDPLVAWNPSPTNGSNPDIDAALPLSWSAGDNASQHDVYLSTDEDALDISDATDTTGIYRGRQNATTYTPPEGLEWGGGPYYWRIDEVNSDGTISTGRIWSFTVADFILVDDFETYTDDDAAGQAIWQHWIDGFGIPDNGAQVGYLMPPYAEQTIIHSGTQSMPLMYDNTAGVSNSEAILALAAPRDWTRHGLTNLSLWFRGYPASVGSFVEAPAGTYTMTASGADIWGTADQFHYAFKTLTGPGSITARINSLQNTHVSAKAGVMIRETLDPDSKHAFACLTSGNGVASQGRTSTGGTSYTTNEDATAPYWVKLERDASGNFTVSHSTNGTSWTSVSSAVPVNIPMTSNVYIGLAVTSHDAAQTCQAVFSNVTTTGNISGQWQHQDVGITSNAAEPMYLELANANGASAVVAHDDPAAATIDLWTEWVIPLQAFADQGVNLGDVDSIAIGLGSKAGIASSVGSGTVYFDDIRLYPPQP